MFFQIQLHKANPYSAFTKKSIISIFPIRHNLQELNKVIPSSNCTSELYKKNTEPNPDEELAWSVDSCLSLLNN